MIWFFELTILILIYIEYKIYKKVITPFSAMAFPYFVIIPLNNIWMTRKGFYLISEQVIIMILFGLFFVFMGSIIVNYQRKLANKNTVLMGEKNTNEFELYNFRGMLIYSVIVNALGFIKFISRFREAGFGFFSLSINEGYMLRGLTGHLLLSAYPVMPILIYYWLHNKKKILYLVSPLMTLSFFFLSFVKYHVIASIILIYLFITFKNRKYIKVGTVLIIVIPVILFLVNYYFSFMAAGLLGRVKSTFYFSHLWKYLGGSLIHDNDIFTQGINENMGVGYKMGKQLFALPNMLMSALVGYKPFFSKLEADWGYVSVGGMGELTNTIDLIGFMFPSKAGISGMLSYPLFALFFISLGFVSTYLFNQAYDNLGNYSKLISSFSFVVFFCFLSFFGVYGVFSIPWELMVWSYVIPNIFYSKARTRFRLAKI